MSSLLRYGLVSLSLVLGQSAIAQAGTITGSIASDVFKFTPNSTASEISSSGAVSMTNGDTTIYVGTHQQSANSKNVIVASVTGDTVNWIEADYELLPPDSEGYGLVWDGADLYVVLTIDGGAPLSDGGLERFTQDGWLSSYGAGGGSRSSVILRLDPDSGDAQTGTFIHAQLSSGETNTIVPTGVSLVNNYVVFEGLSFFSPLNPDRTTMNCTGGSPFEYRAVFSSDLSDALSSEALSCDNRMAFTDLETIVGETTPAPSPAPSPNPSPNPNPNPSPTQSPNPSPNLSPNPNPSPTQSPNPSPNLSPAPNPTPDTGENRQDVPEPGVVMALGAIALVLRRTQES